MKIELLCCSSEALFCISCVCYNVCYHGNGTG